MIGFERAALVVLAAGLSRRYGPGNKLLHPYRGRPLVAHIAALGATLPVMARIAVCPPDAPELDAIFTDAGFAIARNRDPAAGQGSSLACGISTAMETGCTAALVCLGDMPNVTASHLQALLRALDGDAGNLIACTQSEGVRSPPVAIMASRFGDFASVTGDRGGRALLAEAVAVMAAPEMTVDFDTREQLDRPQP